MEIIWETIWAMVKAISRMAMVHIYRQDMQDTSQISRRLSMLRLREARKRARTLELQSTSIATATIPSVNGQVITESCKASMPLIILYH